VSDPLVSDPLVSAATAPVAAIEGRAISVQLDGRPILVDVDVVVPHGSWTSIIGPNGSGKTTLLRALAGLVTYSGTVTIDGRDATSLSAVERAHRVALVPQLPIIPPGFSVADYVMLGRTPHRSALSSTTVRDTNAVAWAIERMELVRYVDRPVERLSGGERQRCVIARALAQQASIVLLDEPTSALDIGRIGDLLALLDDLRATCELTVVTTMHDLTVAGRGATNVVLLHQGSVAARGTPDDVLHEDLLRRVYGPGVRVIDIAGERIVLPH
jgi:iron complex transport system ATP-binding protein